MMAAERIEVKGLNALEKNAAAAQKVLGGLEKQLKGMCAAMTSLFAGITPAQALQSAEKSVKRTTTTVRKESKKVLAVFDEIDRAAGEDTTTTVTQSVTVTTTEQPTQGAEAMAQEAGQLNGITLEPVIAAFALLATQLSAVQAMLTAGVGGGILSELAGIREAVSGIAGAIQAEGLPMWAQWTQFGIGSFSDILSAAQIMSDANIFQGLSNAFSKLGTWLSTTALPNIRNALSVAGAWFRDTLIPGIGSGIEWIKGLGSGLCSLIKDTVIPGMMNVLKGAWSWITGTFLPGIGTAMGKVGSLFQQFGSWIANGAVNVRQGFFNIASAVGSAVTSGVSMAGQLVTNAALWVKDTAVRAANTAAVWAQNAATTAWNAACSVGTALTTAFGAAMTFLTSPIGLVVAAIGALIAIVVLLVKNWDTVKATAIATWQAIKDAFGAAGTWFQEEVLDPLIGGFKGMVNGIIGFLNSMIAGIVAGINGVIGLLNKLKFDVPDWIPGIGGETFGFDLKLLKAPQIPYLAQGAVLPANKPFLAVVGDQKQGTNVEAPLETIKQALAEVMAMQGSGDVNIRFTGDLAQLARVLKPQIDRENRRVGGSMVRRVTG